MACCRHCSLEFRDQDALLKHLRTSTQHSWCARCQKAFNSDMAKQQHIHSSPRHNVCVLCPDAPDFKTARDLETHHSSHNSEGIPEEGLGGTMTEMASPDYDGLPHSIISPVYGLALRLRLQQPTVDYIASQTKTSLDHAIISSLIRAALRLVPVDKSPEGRAAHREKQRKLTAEAKGAEQDFFEELRRLGYDCLSEDQQDQKSGLTPDVRFKKPYLVCGHLCWWLEYKYFFGFRANPFLAQKNKRQFRKYAEKIGPGAVVYNLGYETGHIAIENVKSFREREVRQSLTMQVVNIEGDQGTDRQGDKQITPLCI